MKFCPQCGTTFEPEARFCLECGFDRSLVEMVSPAVTPAPESFVTETPESHATPEESRVSQLQAKPGCPQCGTSLTPEDRFCQECGFDTTTISPAKPEMYQSPIVPVNENVFTQVPMDKETISTIDKKIFCPQCGSNLETGERFCQECGFDTTTISPAKPEMYQSPIVPVTENVITSVSSQKEPVSPIEKKLFCPQCGSNLETGERFCQECGFDTTADKSNSETTFKPLEQPEVLYRPVNIPPAVNAVPPVPEPRKVFPPPPPPPYTPAPAYVPPVRTPKPVVEQKSKKTWLWVAILVIGVGALGTVGWFGYNKYFSTSTESASDTVMNMDIPDVPPLETTSPETEVTAPEAEPTPEQPKATTKPLSRMDQELARQKAKEQSKTAQQTNTSQQQAQPSAAVKISPNAPANSIKTKVLLEVGKKEEPKNMKPKNPTKLMLQKSTMIVRITTDHYNDGMGTSGGGTISIKDRDGNVIGTFSASGRTGKNGTPNAKWVAEPNKMLEKGTYFIWDSDMTTWSKNFVGNGFVVVEGYEVE